MQPFMHRVIGFQVIFQNCQGEGGEAKVACQRIDGAAPYVVLHFTSWEQRLAV